MYCRNGMCWGGIVTGEMMDSGVKVVGSDLVLSSPCLPILFLSDLCTIFFNQLILLQVF